MGALGNEPDEKPASYGDKLKYLATYRLANFNYPETLGLTIYRDAIEVEGANEWVPADAET